MTTDPTTDPTADETRLRKAERCLCVDPGPAPDAGMSTLTRRSFIANTMGAVAAAAASTMLPGGASSARANTPAGASATVPFGGMIQNEFFDDAPYRKAFLDHCDLIMPGNELKFDQLHAIQDEWRFGPGDKLVDFALSNGRLCRGTTHVWWNSTPPWVEGLAPGAEAEAALVAHIETVTDRYKGRLRSWDVVNEPIAHDPAEKGPLRRTTWLEKLGPNHIPIAFAAAARADPACDLVLNDYDLEFKGQRFDQRRAIALEIVRQLQNRNIKIDGVGIQGHLYSERAIDVAALDKFHRDLGALGVGLWVTELDVIDRGGDGSPEAQDASAMRLVTDFLDGVLAFRPPEAVITWGITDRYSWVPDVLPRPDGLPIRPLPLDRNYRPKNWMGLLKQRLAAA